MTMITNRGVDPVTAYPFHAQREDRFAPSRPAPPAYRPDEPVARIVGAFGVAGIAIVHLLDAADTYHSTRYVFWLYMLLVCAAVPVSIALLHWTSSRVWLLVAALAAGPFLGYVASRTVGLPNDSEDVGNWLDTLGMVSLFVEASVIALSLTRWTALTQRASSPRRAQRAM